jgi:hypothetical protein
VCYGSQNGVVKCKNSSEIFRMKLLLISTGWFAAALVVHIVWWRLRLPQGQTSALLKIFAGIYLSGLLGTSFVQTDGIFALDLTQQAYFTIFFIPAALTYSSLYSLIEHDSPSVMIVMALAGAGSQGVTREALMRLFGRGELVAQRLKAAEQNGLLVQVDGGWALTDKGRFFGTIFDAAARIFRFDRAG